MFEKYKYISFDLFDTLVFRTVSSPQAIFSLVPIVYNERNEKEKIKEQQYYIERIYAESIARKRRNKEDVSLEEIYSYVNYPPNINEKLKNIEIELEIKNCVMNNAIIPLVQECVRLEKKLIITTDMYLSRSCIEKILEKIKIPYDKLYISSEIGLSKSSGNLFDYILTDLDIQNTDIVHIGDNLISDIAKAKSRGIECQIRPYNQPNKCYTSHRVAVNPGLDHLIGLARIYAKDTIASRVGTFVIGPILVEFCNWIHKKKNDLKIERLYFIAREGYLIKLFYDQLFPEDIEKSFYIRLNKNMLRLPSISLNPTINEFIKNLPQQDTYTWKEILDIFFLASDLRLIKEELGHKGRELNSTQVLYRDDIVEHKYDDIIRVLIKYAIRKGDEQTSLLLQYMQENEMLEGRIGLVNNSINGNAQSIIENICLKFNKSLDVFGLQFVKSVMCEKKLGKKVDSWLNSKILPYSVIEEFKYECILFEQLLFENAGTARSLSWVDNRIRVDLEDIGLECKNKPLVSEIQEKSLELIELYKNNIYIPIGQDVVDLYLQLKINPYPEDLDKFSMFIDKNFDVERKFVEDIDYNTKYLLGGKLIPNEIIWAHGYFLKVEAKNRVLFNYINLLRFNRLSLRRWWSFLRYRIFDRLFLTFLEKLRIKEKGIREVIK